MNIKLETIMRLITAAEKAVDRLTDVPGNYAIANDLQGAVIDLKWELTKEEIINVINDTQKEAA